MEEIIKVSGIVRFREIPADWGLDDFLYWWVPEVDCDGRIIRKARMSEKEKRARTVWENHNLITSNGRAALLSYMGSNTTTLLTSFAAQMSLGSTNIVQVYPSDTTVAGEYFRKQPNSATQSGNVLDIATILLNAEAVGLITNSGLWGGAGVSSTLGSGTLYAHSLVVPNFQKANGSSYTVDWSLSLN